MLEGLKEALQYVVNLGNDAEKVQVLEICGETYANKRLERYGAPKRASAIGAASLSAMVDYIAACSEEFDGKKMVIQIDGPKTVRLVSFLDSERKRECLFLCEAETSEYRFGAWYDQEEFMIAVQSNFATTPDLEAIMQKREEAENQLQNLRNEQEQWNQYTRTDCAAYDILKPKMENRAQILAQREMEYVTAAKAMGIREYHRFPHGSGNVCAAAVSG